jgi:hypothetical protein
MPRNSLTTEVIEDEIKSALGGSQIEIELGEDDFDKSLKDCIRVYNRNRPGFGRCGIAVTPQQKKYGPLNAWPVGVPPAQRTLPTTIQGIDRVQFVTNQAPVTDPFDTINNGIGRILSGQGTPFGEIDQQLGYIKMARWIASSDPEYQILWEGDQLFLYVDIARTPVLASITYKYHYTPDDDPNTGVGMIPDSDTDFIVGFILARAKQILGRARGKYGGVFTEEGGTIEVDAAPLIQEGKEEEGEWMEEIRKRRRPLPPVLG